MSLPLRPRAIPQCSVCLRSYAFAGFPQIQSSALRQQVRGKRKMPNNSQFVTVKLLKDVEFYGPAGSFVPIPPGTMRNRWFPKRIAEYVTLPELKRLRLASTPMERIFEFEVPGKKKNKKDAKIVAVEEHVEDTTKTPVKAPEVKRMSPTRMMELVDILIPPRLEFYRQPIIEPKIPEKPSEKPEMPLFSGAAGDLLAARLESAKKAAEKPQAIYGSVSPQDVLVAMRAVMACQEDAALVVLQESDIAFVDMPELEGTEAGRVKHVGDFSVEVWVKGASKAVRRTVRVIPQEIKGAEMEEGTAV